jgi:3-oxoacyl-[acyl-carrier protein] reductase
VNFGLTGRVALVTGASSGLGKAIAKTLVQEGARVAICSRDPERIAAAGREVGAALAVAADVSAQGASRQLVGRVEAELGSCDVLVVNTGGPPKAGFEALTREAWQEAFDGLWLSAVEAIQAALPGMKARGFGRILLVTSVAAREPMEALTLSNGLRAGLLGLAKSLSVEVAGHGVTVNTLLPGYTATERLTALGLDLERVAQTVPARRLGTPEEFAALAAFLASQQAGYITGQAVAADGGWMRSY